MDNTAPKSFGSDFDPVNNPPDPNHPSSFNPPQQYLDPYPVHHLSSDNSVESTPPPPSKNDPMPSLIQVNPKEDTKDEDPPLVKVTNPVTYLKKWWKKVMANEGIDIGFKFKVKPVTAIIVLGFIASNGLTFSAASFLFPHSSPVFHREIMYQGNLQKTPSGFILTLPNSDLYTLKPKPNTNINYDSLNSGPALVKGNLTSNSFVIEVSEIIPLGNPSPAPISYSSTPPIVENQDSELPNLYSDIKWETTQKKTLLFTSGKRRIEQEGVYLESSLLTDFPQDFVNYYNNVLQNSGFKQTLNSNNPSGITITYSKDELFLTFGVKNVYSGSADLKKITGYRAYIEHN